MEFGEPVKTVSRCFMVCISGIKETVSGGFTTFDRQVLICGELARNLLQSRYGVDCEAGTPVSFMAFILLMPNMIFFKNSQMV
jgi:hypothetical protein